MADNKKNSKQSVILIVTVLTVLFISVIIYGILLKHSENKLYKELGKETYTSVFIADFDTKNYKKEVFDKYIGGNNLVYTESDVLSIGRELKYITANYEFDTVRVGLNPFENDYKFFAGKTLGRALNSAFYNSIEDNPGTSFQILLYCPNGFEWKNEKHADKKIHSYEQLVNSLATYDNVTIYFPGYEEWVIDNRLLYSNEDFGQKIEEEWIPMTFCDGMYIIDSQNQWDKYNELTVNIENSKDGYPNMDEVDIVFFGDSIIGNYTGVSSIPGDVHALTGASVINLGVGGTKASTEFEKAVAEYFSQSLRSDNRRVYVINYGLNDFFEGIVPEDTEDVSYEGGLNKGIENIKANDESALIVVIAPNYVECCGDGTGTVTENGPVIERYIKAAKKVSEEKGTLFINMYTELDFNGSNCSEYLLDGVHLNGKARMKYSKILVEEISKYYEKQQ